MGAFEKVLRSKGAEMADPTLGQRCQKVSGRGTVSLWGSPQSVRSGDRSREAGSRVQSAGGRNVAHAPMREPGSIQPQYSSFYLTCPLSTTSLYAREMIQSTIDS